MEVVAGGPAGGAHIAHHIPLLYGLALLAADAAHMGVEGAGAVAVGDDYIVAVGPAAAGALGGVDNHTALGGIDVGAGGGGDVDAGVVARLAGDGVDAPAGQGGNGIISPRQGPQVARLAGHVGDLGGVLPLLGLDLGVQGLGGLVQLLLHLLQQVLMGADFGDELVHLVLLGLQLVLGGHLLGLGRLLLRLGILQGGAVVRHLLLEGHQTVDHLVVILDDLLDHHVVVQQLGEIAGRKQDGPVGGLSLLLHVPHPPAEQVKLGLLVGFCLLQLHRLLGNELVIHGNLLVDVGNLLADQVDLVLQQLLFLQGAALVRLDRLQLGLNVFFLLGQLSGVPLQGVDLRLGDGGGLKHHPRPRQGQEHGQCQQQHNSAAQQPALFHSDSSFSVGQKDVCQNGQHHQQRQKSGQNGHEQLLSFLPLHNRDLPNILLDL